MSRMLCTLAVLTTTLPLPLGAAAATPTVAQALGLQPIHDNVEYDTPGDELMENCTIESIHQDGLSGWTVRLNTGQLLRRFVDTNGDKKVDQWCYYLDGVEVYRDIDADFNGKADQYRWLGTAGTRWGLDRDEDSRIDDWKTISAEEVTAELVEAIRHGDKDRFANLLISAAEIDELGLGKGRVADLKAKSAAALAGFASLARQQATITTESKWIHFGASRPGTLPAGSDGSTQDVTVYDNVAAVIQTAGKHAQINVGTLILVGDAWKLIDLPNGLTGEEVVATTGFFFQVPDVENLENNALPEGGVSEELQTLIDALDKIDSQLADATDAAQQSQLNAQRADVLEKLAKIAGDEQERETWIRQLADTVSAAVQSGQYTGGVDRLKKLADRYANDANKDLAAYLYFRWMSAEYAASLNQPEADFAAIQEKWLADLKQFVADFPDSDDAAEAMLQLAVAEEFSGQSAAAVGWYTKIVTDFGSTDFAKKAAGAKRRLESVGQTLSLSGKTIEGDTLRLSQYHGNIVLVHYWATWCGPCKDDMKVLRDMQAKYGRQGFALVGINLDNEKEAAIAFLRSNRLPWAQLYEPGGLDGRLANELGVLTLPTMLLIDQEGRVISRNINAAELDAELSKRLR